MAYDLKDREASTESVLERIRNGTLRLNDQVGVIDEKGSFEVAARDYILYHLSADDTIVTIEYTHRGADLLRFDDETGLSKDGRTLRLVEPVFQLAVRDQYAVGTGSPAR